MWPSSARIESHDFESSIVAFTMMFSVFCVLGYDRFDTGMRFLEEKV